MLWKINHNGFHGFNTVSIRVPDGSKAGDTIHVTPAVAKRLNRAVCGITGCTCGEHIAYHADRWDGWYVILPDNNGDVRGYYPQN